GPAPGCRPPADRAQSALRAPRGRSLPPLWATSAHRLPPGNRPGVNLLLANYPQHRPPDRLTPENEVRMLRVAAWFAFDHDPALVALAAAICLLACLTYFSMLGRAIAARGNAQLAWVAGAAAAFGGGIWATHFIALIGFRTALQP